MSLASTSSPSQPNLNPTSALSASEMSFFKRLSTRRSKSPLTENDTIPRSFDRQESLPPAEYSAASTLHPDHIQNRDDRRRRERAKQRKLSQLAMNDAPPAYTPADAGTASTYQPTPAADSPYAFLAQFDTVFVIDDSGSMAGQNWEETAAALGAITPICTEQDADGIDIYFLNHRNPYGSDVLGGYKNVTTTPAVQEIFSIVRPGASTPTGTRLNSILKNYIAGLEKAKSRGQEASVKPLNIIMITDGEASDDVEAVIVSAAKKLDKLNAEPWQVGIQFFQVGRDPAATTELRELDDSLSSQHGIRDMVDTVPWSGVKGTSLTADGIMKVTMGAINRKLDRKKATDERLRRK